MAVKVIEQNAETGNNLKVIRRAQIPVEQMQKKRVAAYCRVSKDIEEQETSIRIQMESYNQIIREHPDWELAGIYADKGKTGTNMKKRVEFRQMIQDAKDGKIDMILAKSTSRFARNTVDLLTVTRELREIGVGVYFEKEKINTLSLQSEMLLTVYAAFAQEESHSISENMKRGMRQRFEIGTPKWSDIYGFRRNGKDEWIPVPEEAEIVVEIFELYLSGMGASKIADLLERRGVQAPSGGKKWPKSSVLDIVTNEKYAGDCLMQKYYSIDHLSHKSVKNKNMVVDQYYKENHHEALVPRDYYEDATRIQLMKDSHRGAIQYPYYGRLVCPFCGQPMVKVRVPSGKNTNAWVCGGEDKGTLYTDRTDCEPYWVKEPYLSDAVKKAILNLDTFDAPEDVIEYLIQAKKEIRDGRNIEFMDLKKLVKSMTFPDWDTLEVTWNWGEKSETGYNVSGYVEYPDPTIREEYGQLWVGNRRVSENVADTIESSVPRIRDAILDSHIFTDHSKRFSLPPLVSTDENRPGYGKKSGAKAEEESA